LVFLTPFKRCTKCFECNNTNPEIGTAPGITTNSDYVFFAYDVLFNHIEDIVVWVVVPVQNWVRGFVGSWVHGFRALRNKGMRFRIFRRFRLLSLDIVGSRQFECKNCTRLRIPLRPCDFAIPSPFYQECGYGLQERKGIVVQT
jgi:hypothetical protein